MHKCDNRKCVNPLHLKLGTQKENLQDMYRKGRQAKNRNLPSGENHHMTKLTKEEVRAIRVSKESGPKLSDKYVVTRQTINNIKTGRTWKDCV